MKKKKKFISKFAENSVDNLLFDLTQTGLKYKDLEIKQKNLEEIFLSLVKNES